MLRAPALRILGLGDNTVDTYVDSGLQFPGGNAVNVAVLCRRLGAQAAYLGCLGSDEAGDLLRASLAAEGVDLSRCRRIDGANARARIAHNDGDRRFIGSTPGVRARYDLRDDDFAFIARHDLTHSSIYSELEADLPRIADSAPLLSFDYSERWTLDRLGKTLPFLDIAFLSYPNQPDAACAALLGTCADRDVGVAVVTRGAAGAMARIDGAVLHQGVVPTTVVDTLGAGDGFIAGFLVALLAGASPGDSLRRGAENAARVCTWQGAFGHARPWTESASAAAGRA